MQKKDTISMSVIRRLPRYYRFLSEMSRSGVVRVSSKDLAEKTGLTASQIRQDFNCFGGFGQQGYGYPVPELCAQIGQILGLQNRHKCILIGAGNLGKAIAGHMSFSQLGFELIGVFDQSPEMIGQKIKAHEILSFDEIEEFIRLHHPSMAILCIPGESAPAVSDQLYNAGIRSFWNFSHYDIALKYPDVVTENVHMNDSLMTLCYQLSQDL